MKNIFSPVQLGGIALNNRVVRSATNDYSGNPDGSVSAVQLDLYRTLARNGPGLIITGNFFVRPDGRVDQWQNSLDASWHKASVSKLVDTIHHAGGRVVFQINHAGRKSKVSAQARARYASVDGLPIELIEEIASDFVSAALRAKEANADGVQLHCGHGYLLSDFLDPGLNQRKDAYGGDAGGRFWLAENILTGIRTACGPEYPVLIKINATIPHNNGVVNVGDLEQYCRIAKSAGVVAAEISGSDFVSFGNNRRNYYMEQALRVKAASGLPVLLAGGIRSIQDAQEALNNGIDLVSLSRPFICEPNLLEQWQAGAVARCISCSRCFSLYGQEGRRCIFHK